MFQSIFPYTQQVIADYPLMNDAAIDKCLLQAGLAFETWRQFSFTKRSEIFKNVAAILKRDKEVLARVITFEMGKIFAESIAEIEKCAYVCEYYAEQAESFLMDQQREAGYKKSFVSYQPIGAVLGIMPWNFPFWQVFRYAAPTLMAGNVSLLKHAPNVCGCAKKIEAVFLEAGLPTGVFQTLIIDTAIVERLLEFPLIQAVTFTGSETAGSRVAMLAGKNIKRSLLELGGSDALIVLPDADMKKAAATAVQSRMQNAGQSCIAAKRLIVLKEAMVDFMNEFDKLVKTLKQGDPFDTTVTTGPMARPDLAEKLQLQMQQSIKKGARLMQGGTTDGCNFSPALLMEIEKGMPAFDEETFGPMAAVITAADETAAIAMANDSRYGLSGSIWTRDIEKGIALARKIDSGSVFINSLVKSDPALPFGGIKKSGYGRELGREGILEFVNVKTIAAT